MKTQFTLFVAIICGMCLTGSAVGQVVQLPSVASFSYSGSALVPDGGTVGLAGNAYAASSSSSTGWGPYGQRASGSMYGSSGVSASVQIIDLQALDEAILSSGTRGAGKAKPTTSTSSSTMPPARSVVGGVSQQGPGPSIDPGKWQRVLAGGYPSIPAHTQLAESDIRYYLKMGQEAEAANRIVSARVYYRMAIEAMTPDMKVRYERTLVEREESRKAEAERAKADRMRF